MEPLDKDVVNLTKAIRKVESNDNFTVRSKDGSFGAYQFLKPTWDATAKKYGVNAEWGKATPQQQNEVAYKQVKEWKDKGYNPGQIASMWNAGAGRPNAYLEGMKGTNKSGVNYDVGAYAKKVATNYQAIKQETSPQVNKSIERWEMKDQGLPVSSEKRFQEQGKNDPTFGGQILRDIAKPFARAGTNIVNAAQVATGNQVTQPFSGGYLGEVKPVGQEGNFGQKVKDAVGVGGQIASNLPVARGAGIGYQGMKTAFQSGGKEAFKQVIKPLAKEGAFGGGSSMAGEALTENKSLPQAIGQGIIGAGVGALAAPVLGMALPVAGAGARAIANKVSPSEGFLTQKLDKHILDIYKDTTADVGKIQEMATKAKQGLDLLASEQIEIPDIKAPLGSKIGKPLSLTTGEPNELISGVVELDKRIAKAGEQGAENAQKQGLTVDTSNAKGLIISAINKAEVPKATGMRMLKQLEDLGNDPVKIHKWIQEINIKYKNKYQRGTIDDTMTGALADSVAKELRERMNQIVYRQEYASAYAANQELKRILVAIAKKANKQFNVGDLTDDAVIDGAFAVLTGNPVYMARTLATGVLKGFFDSFKNSRGLRSFRKAAKVSKKLNVKSKLPSSEAKPQKPQLLLPAPKSGSPKSSINTPINLGARSQSTIDTQEMANMVRNRTVSKPNKEVKPNSKKVETIESYKKESELPVIQMGTKLKRPKSELPTIRFDN